MNRIPFSEVLKNASIDIHREYDRLYGIFYLQKIPNEYGNNTTLKDSCALNFINLPFRGTCVSLDDFDDFYDYNFEKAPSDFSIDYLISFCEYSYNLAIYNQGVGFAGLNISVSQSMQFYVQQVNKVIEVIGYMPNTQNGITDFVPKDQAAISVAEIVNPELSYKVIEYNHHSMKGNLEGKRAILIALADRLEPDRKTLKQINNTLDTDLFYLFNNINIRHNNVDKNGGYYKSAVASMDNDETEKWYDETYQMCLLAFLELEHNERKKRVADLKKTING